MEMGCCSALGSRDSDIHRHSLPERGKMKGQLAEKIR